MRASELERRPGRVARRDRSAGRRPQPRVEAVARRDEASLHERLARSAGVAAAGLPVGQRLHQRSETRDRPHRRLGVHGAHLDGAELRMWAHVPPHERVVAQPPGLDDGPDRLGVVGERRERSRDVRPGKAAEELGARAGEPGVAPVPERRVGGQRLQQRQVLPQAVAHADRRLLVGHRDVDVQRRGRRAAHQSADLLGEHRVALARRMDDVAEGAVGVEPRPERGPARGAHPPAQRVEGRGPGPGIGDHGRRQLDHRRVGVGMGTALLGSHLEAVEEIDARVDERMRARVHHDELLLDPQRELLGGAEAHRGDGAAHGLLTPVPARSGPGSRARSRRPRVRRAPAARAAPTCRRPPARPR